MADEEVVQGTETLEEVVSEGEQSQEKQPLDEVRVQQMISEAVGAAKETGKRELQSSQDKNKAEVARLTRRAVLAEGGLQATEDGLGALDEETRNAVELKKLREQAAHSQNWEAEDRNRQQLADTYRNWGDGMSQYITTIGLDPTKVTWGDDSEPILEKEKRIFSEIGKMQKDKMETDVKAQDTKFKDMELALRKELGLDTGSVPAGAGAGDSDKTFAEKMADSDYVATAEDNKRTDKILKGLTGNVV